MTSILVEFVERQNRVGEWAHVVAPAVGRAFASLGDAGRDLKDSLNGVWLGHPLHPVLTDIPLGAWTAAIAFDTADEIGAGAEFGRAADAAIVVGLAGAAGAAVTGLTDWSDTGGKSQHVGFAHGMLNLTATGLFALSTVLRRRRERRQARGFALAGYMAALSAAYLGGHLVYERKIGVNHASGLDLPEGFTRVIASADLPDNRPTRVVAGQTPLVLVRQGDRITAMVETCAHQGGPLSEGEIRDGSIVCPWHGSQFDLADGHVVHGPSVFSQPCLDVRVEDGYIAVRSRSEA